MVPYLITTDSTVDLPLDYQLEHELILLPLSYTLDGKVYNQENALSTKEFYECMRAGAMPTTSQVNPETAKEIFKEILQQKKRDILHIAFSSGLSGSYNSARLAAEELQEESNHKIVVIDSLSASMGEGLLVHKAIQLKKQGKSIDELAKWIEENKLRICHNFTVFDLNHLYRGGRVSKTAAVLGTMVNIKPVLHMDDEGHLVAVGKVRGRKKSLTTLVDNMEKQIASCLQENREDVVFISHADAKEDALFVADLVKERFGIEHFLISEIGPVIGSHTGPGVVALFFVGEKR